MACIHEWTPYLNTPTTVICKHCSATGTVTITPRPQTHLAQAREDYEQAGQKQPYSSDYFALLELSIGHIICHVEEQAAAHGK